jgi:hypothetical protein
LCRKRFLFALILPILLAFTFANAGHYFYENYPPKTRNNLHYAALAELKMIWELLTGKIKF